MYNDYQDSNEQYNNDYNNYNYSQYNPTGSNVLRNKALPITLTWNANAWVKNKLSLKEKIMSRFSSDDDDDAEFKQILTNVRGIVKPGQLCAIMGASGAGKTTLLNILNFRNKGKMIIEADVKINGVETDWDMITRYSGFVQQDDLFHGVLTVREHLTFVTMLKLGNSYTKEERFQRIDEIVQEVNLVKSEDTIIGVGDKLKGLSGGEKRRLAYASEIVNNPSLLFCDEPTSGLDSSMAQSLVESMRKLADQGKTVICTIHQPSSQIFEMFDTLIVLAEGRLAYLGPNSMAPNFFSRIGYPVPYLYNPADHYIQTLAISPQDRENSLYKVKIITDEFERSELYSKMIYDIQLTESRPMNDDDDDAPKYNSSYPSQLGWLLWRQLKMDFKNPLATKVVALQTIIVAIFLGLIFLRLEENEIGVQNRTGALFIVLMQCNFAFLFGVVATFPQDLVLVYRESKNRIYSITPYFLVKQIAELPKFVILSGLLVTIVYWMAGLNDDFGVFIQILLTLILCAQVAISYGLFISAIAPNIDAALAMVVPIMMPLLIFAGFFLNDVGVPDYFIWLKYISWFFYTNEIINVYLWRNVDSIPCTKDPNGTNICAANGCFQNGQEFLDANGFKESMLPLDFVVLILLFFIFRILAFVILRIKILRS
uniref:ATP-binding cassette transporter subfamily G-like protein 5 n=1 Tax=Brachionus plicatilis TaxID=10195 RepID=A0A7H9SLC0_BRAPC|nr:ATP-binding cassette transporter subfamily G-like protein 5 [Brachionus plicatilis]